MLAEQETVVGRDDHRRILPHIVGIHIVEQPAQILVAHADQTGIICTDLGDLLLGFVDALVWRPVQHAAVPGAVAFAPEPVRHVEWLVRIEELELHHPVVGGPVGVEELEGGGEAARCRHVFFAVFIFTCHQVTHPQGQLLRVVMPTIVELAHFSSGGSTSAFQLSFSWPRIRFQLS